MKVRGSAAESVPDQYQTSSDWTATWTYRDGDWHGTCEGTSEHDWDEWMEEELGYNDTTTTFARTFSASDPPHWPLFNTRNPPAESDDVEVWLMWDCRITSETMVYTGVVDHDRAGRAHRADDTQEAEENYSDFTAFWDTDTGLVLSWGWGRRHSGTSGEVMETDAPLS